MELFNSPNASMQYKIATVNSLLLAYIIYVTVSFSYIYIYIRVLLHSLVFNSLIYDTNTANTRLSKCNKGELVGTLSAI